MATISNILKMKGAVKKPKHEPLWKGPTDDGITYSMLCKFLSCRERFRVLVMEGLRSADTFNHRTGYGDMWHVCEEALAAGNRMPTWEQALQAHGAAMCQKYPQQQAEIDKWYNVCKVQFPVYVDHWAKHPDVKDRQPMFQEQVFNVAHPLPSGRVVRLRGKWDSVDLIGKGKQRGVWLQEDKTKSEINERRLVQQLSMDLQTMIYLVSLESTQENMDGGFNRFMGPILGVRYNVIRRPLSGGKGSIVQHKPTKKNPRGESKADYYARLRGIIAASPSDYFTRWQVVVSRGDIERFKTRVLNPILENLCDWWDYITTYQDPFAGDINGHNRLHWQHPYGVYNPLDEGYSSDLDEYLANGSTVGLQRVDHLFTELV